MRLLPIALTWLLGSPNALWRCFPRKEIAAKSWNDYGGIIVVANWDEGAALADRVAPEHLEIATADPNSLLAKVRHAGAIFLGSPPRPEAMGVISPAPTTCCRPRGPRSFPPDLSVLPDL